MDKSNNNVHNGALHKFAMDVDNYISANLPNKKEQLLRDSIFKYVTDCVSELQQDVIHKSAFMEVSKFGSEMWNVSCKDSDMDIAISVYFTSHRVHKQQLLDKLMHIISENELYVIDSGYIALLNASYPIIRFTHKIYKIQVDISIADRYCLPTNVYILKCINHFQNDLNIPIKKLIIFIKYWSKQRQINDAYHLYLNSFGYLLLTINYIQSTHRYHRHSRNLVDLIFGFFKFYATIFDPQRHAISISSTSSKIHTFIKKSSWSPLEIIDPISQWNIAHRVAYYQCNDIMDEFRRAYLMLNKYFRYDYNCNTSKQSIFKALTQNKAINTKTISINIEEDGESKQEEKRFDESEYEQMATTLTCKVLKELKPLEQKRMIGERLYPKILMKNIEQKLAGKVMVVLLSMDNDKLLELLSMDNEQKTFRDAIDKAVDMLQKQNIV